MDIGCYRKARKKDCNIELTSKWDNEWILTLIQKAERRNVCGTQIEYWNS